MLKAKNGLIIVLFTAPSLLNEGKLIFAPIGNENKKGSWRKSSIRLFFVPPASNFC